MQFASISSGQWLIGYVVINWSSHQLLSYHFCRHTSFQALQPLKGHCLEMPFPQTQHPRANAVIERAIVILKPTVMLSTLTVTSCIRNRFMGDLPEPQYDQSLLAKKDTAPVMHKIYDTIGKSFAKKNTETLKSQKSSVSLQS